MISNKLNSARRLVLLLVFCLLHASFVFPQGQAPKKDEEAEQLQASLPAPAIPPRPALAFGLVEDTPVRLRLVRTMSSKDATAGEKVDFEVVEDVKIGETVVIQHGGMAIATVTETQHRRRMGRSGKLNMNIDYVQLISGEKVSLRAVKGGKGGNRTAAMTGALVASGILFFPAAPFFLFIKGKDITIPKGTEVTAYVAADTSLDPAKFNQSTVAVESTTSNSEAGSPSGMTSVAVKSTPDGAEIMIDGKLLGTTPSTVLLTAGEHSVVIDKSGFKSWQRTITVTEGGAINLEATLDKTP